VRPKPTKSWETVRAENPVNECRAATYARLMDAQERIARARYRRGVSDEKVQEALAASALDDAEVVGEEELYLRSLAQYVAALGGHVEVVAVFPEETISVRREPEAMSPPERAA
jgi:hypothetical protein